MGESGRRLAGSTSSIPIAVGAHHARTQTARMRQVNAGGADKVERGARDA